jgi:rubrerythrin
MFGFNANEIFSIAIKIEENGQAFYREVAGSTEDSDIKNIFKKLEREELDHKNRFLDLKSLLPDSASQETIWDPDNEIDSYLKMLADMNIFSSQNEVEEKLRGIGSMKDAIRFAISFEKDSVLFYLSMKGFTEEAKGREFIDQLIEEEKKHLKRLALLINRCGD